MRSACGRIDGRKALGVRCWSCPCDAVHDRATKAARSIFAAGLLHGEVKRLWNRHKTRYAGGGG